MYDLGVPSPGPLADVITIPNQPSASDASRRSQRESRPTASLSPEELQRRWDLVLPYRAEMLEIARRRVATFQDAEDAVATALLRTVTSRNLDERRVGAYLCTVVMRLTVDSHRDRARQLAVGRRQHTREVGSAAFEDEICDQAEARWLAEALESAPGREREVLAARLNGMSTAEVAVHLQLSRKSAENAFTRLRVRADRLVAATLSLLGALWTYGRRSGGAAATAAPALLVAFAIVTPLAPTAEPPRSGAARAHGGPALPQTPVLDPKADSVVPPSVPAPVEEVPTGSRPASAVKPAQERKSVARVEAPPLAPEVVTGGGVRVDEQDQYENETFLESAERCLKNVVLTDPLKDPCR
jgi:RNA polymerase sigma factor (sigma-70 family)